MQFIVGLHMFFYNKLTLISTAIVSLECKSDYFTLAYELLTIS